METKNILLDGFHVTFDSRSLFMQEIFRYPKVRDKAVLRLLKEGELEEWKKDESATIGGGHFVRMELQKQIEISESKLKASQEQILNLKAFIDYSSVENPEKYEETNREINTSYWAEKRVLVIGGHPSWQ